MLLIFAAVIFVHVINEYLKNLNVPNIQETLKKRNEQITKWLS